MSTYNVSTMCWHWECRAILLYPSLFVIWETYNGYYYSGLGMTGTRTRLYISNKGTKVRLISKVTHLQRHVAVFVLVCCPWSEVPTASAPLALYHVFFYPYLCTDVSCKVMALLFSLVLDLHSPFVLSLIAWLPLFPPLQTFIIGAI